MAAAKKPLDPIYARMLDVLREYVFKVQPGTKITQDDIAEYFNFNQNTVSTWKSKGPSISPLKKLANEFNISLDWLILGKGPKLSVTATEISQENTVQDVARSLSKQEHTIQDVARSLSKLATITDMRIEQCTQDNSKMNTDKRNYKGIQITLFPRCKIFYTDEPLSSAISRIAISRMDSEKGSLVSMDKEIMIEDNRGDLLLNFLRLFAKDLEEYRDSIYSRVDYDINSRVNLLISSLPTLSLAPIPDNLNKDEIYQYPVNSAESKKIPWFKTVHSF